MSDQDFIVRKLFILFSSQNQLQSIDEEEKVDNQSYQENPILFKTLSKDLNVDQKKILYREYYQQGNTIFLFL